MKKKNIQKASSFTFYLLFYAALACLAPYLVLYYQERGFNGAQIGLLAGVSPLIALVASPFLTGLADRYKHHRLILSLTIFSVVVLAIFFPVLRTLAPIFLLVMVFSFFSAPIIPLADSSAMSMLGEEREKYGRLRLGGTFGWAAVAPLAGLLVQNYGLRLAFWGYAALMFLALLVCQEFTFSQPAHGSSFLKGIRTVLADRRWIFFLLMVFVGGMGLAVINNYLFAYMVELGAKESISGIALTISTISELPVFFFSNRLLRKFTSYGLLIIALVFTALRMLLFALLNFPMGILASQLLNGLCFPAVAIAGVSYADEHAPAGMRATAQGLFGAVVIGFGGAAGGFFGGLLLDNIGGRGMYFIFGVVVLVSIAVITFVEKRLSTRQSREAHGDV